jgi:hypothetical protein
MGMRSNLQQWDALLQNPLTRPYVIAMAKMFFVMEMVGVLIGVGATLLFLWLT